MIKDKKIYFLFADFDIEIGGVGSTVIGRASSLAEKGYDVTLLNLALIKNFDNILNYLYDNNFLSKKVKFINIYQYYSDKNNLNHLLKKSEIDCEGYEKTVNSDQSVVYDYYYDDELIKSKMYIDDALVFEKSDKKLDFYTSDGFNYLQRRNRKYILHNRYDKSKKEFKNTNKFLDYFLNEVCFSKEMPILVCDSTTHWYNLNGIDKEDAYLIGSLHGNPYVNGEINSKIKHFKKLDDYDALVLLTNEVAEDLSKTFDNSKFNIIPNFVNERFLENLNVEKDYNKISIFSRISPEKQISDAIKAFEIVSSRNTDAKLHIYGRALVESEKLEFEKLKLLVDELNLNDKVIFKGYISDVRSAMQESLCVLLTSKNEGLPLMLLESMASATPVIAYNLKYGPKDLITNYEDGIIVNQNNIQELAEAMVKLLDNPEIAVQMGVKAKKKIENKYVLDIISKKWEDLFVKVYNKRNPKGLFSKIKNFLKK